jgi:peroxiredoxin
MSEIKAVKIDQKAPKFALKDIKGKIFRLSEYEGKANILLVFNRGFT